jgi:hypothetical protein
MRVGGVPYRHKYWIHPYNAPCSLPNSPMLMGPSFAYAYALSDPPVSEFQARVRMAESAARKSVEYLDPHVFATCLLVLGAHVSCVPEIVRKERQKPQNRASRETGATAVPFSAILRSSPSLPPSPPAFQYFTTRKNGAEASIQGTESEEKWPRRGVVLRGSRGGGRPRGGHRDARLRRARAAVAGAHQLMN